MGATRRVFSREYKVEAVKLIRERGVSYAQAAGARLGANLVAFDTRKIEVSLEILSVEVYSTATKTVRALVRGS